MLSINYEDLTFDIFDLSDAALCEHISAAKVEVVGAVPREQEILSRFLAVGLRELAERGKSAELLQELSRLTETSKPEASSDASIDHKSASAQAAVACTPNVDDASAGGSSTLANADDTGRNREVLEASLVAFKGEKRRAERAHRTLRTTTAEQSKPARQDNLRMLPADPQNGKCEVGQRAPPVGLSHVPVPHRKVDAHNGLVQGKASGRTALYPQGSTSIEKPTRDCLNDNPTSVPDIVMQPAKNDAKHLQKRSSSAELLIEEEIIETVCDDGGPEAVKADDRPVSDDADSIPADDKAVEPITAEDKIPEDQLSESVLLAQLPDRHSDVNAAEFSNHGGYSERTAHEANISDRETLKPLLSDDELSVCNSEDDTEVQHGARADPESFAEIKMRAGDASRAVHDAEIPGFGDCNGQGLGNFHFGDDEDELTAWDTSPRLQLAVESTSVKAGISSTANERNATVVSASISSSTEKKLASTSIDPVEEAITRSADQRQVDATPALFDSTSDDGCPSQPIQYHAVYDSFNQLFTAFHRPSSKQVGLPKKKIEQYNAVEVAELYESLCSHLQKYKTASHSPSHQVVRVSRNHPEVHHIVTQGLPCDGVHWVEEDKENICETWNLMWTWSSKVSLNYSNLLVWQRINHYPRIKELTRKDLLKRHLEKCQRLYGGSRLEGAFNIMPTTFNLPKEYILFVEQFHADASQLEDPNSNLWIMKPISLSRGRGISVLNDVSDVLRSEPVVVQRYIRNPLLIDGFKWDLRLYVLVTSFNPLETFIYDEGFARFATHPYSRESADITNNFIHLTNASIQGKHVDGAASPPSVIKNGSVHGSQRCVNGGTKCSLQHLSFLLQERGVDFSALWDQIVIVILRALFAVQDSIPHQANSFELLGFDIIIDEFQKPWLLEANSSPSLAISTPLDKIVKESLIRDTLALVDPLPFNREALHLALQTRLNGKTFNGTGDRSSLNAVLTDILGGKVPRQYGDLPEKLGNFSRIAPSRALSALLRLRSPIS